MRGKGSVGPATGPVKNDIVQSFQVDIGSVTESDLKVVTFGSVRVSFQIGLLSLEGRYFIVVRGIIGEIATVTDGLVKAVVT